MRRTVMLLSLLTLVAATPALAGPPWISVETPANPYMRGTRDALCLIRVYHHGDPAYTPLTASAEGLVGGARQSVPLTLIETGVPGVYGVKFQPEREGTWMVVVRVGEDKDYAGATVLARLDRDGRISRATVPTRQDGQHLIPLRVTRADIDRMLQQEATSTRADAGTDATLPVALAGLLLPLAIMVRRRH
jgi:hypothetical protein